MRVSTARVRNCLFVMVSVSLLAAIPAAAQEEGDPSELARFRFGPLRFTPSIVLKNVGIDNNVFNDAENPRGDTVGALGPASDFWMHVGSSLMAGKASVEYLYFDRYKNERALNTVDNLKWEVPLARLTPFVEGSYANAKMRSGFEIDSRIRQTAESVGLGTELRVTDKMRLVMSGHRTRVKYGENETFLGTPLAQELNSDTNTESLHLRYRMTSLTTFVVKANAVQDRFAGDSLRNANSIIVTPGFEMKPAALVAGAVFVGVRRFEPLNPVMPAYRGPVASVDATYIARASKIGVKVARDLAFSYQADQPYYTLTDVMLTLTERLGYSWDVVLTGGRQWLDYSVLRTAVLAGDPQHDTVRQFGGGIGYRVGHTLRVGVDAVYFVRRSNNVAFRDFEGMRAGLSISYGLPQ